MATETATIKLKIIEDSDAVTQDLFNTNSNILESQLSAIKTKVSELDTEKASVGALSTLETTVGTKADKTYVDSKFLLAANYNRTRAILYSGTDQIIRYPWAGTIKQVQVNCSTTRTDDVPFYLDKISKVDYEAGGATWTRIGGADFAMHLLTSDVYKEYTSADITTNTAIVADDLIKITIDGTAVDNLTIQVLVENS